MQIHAIIPVNAPRLAKTRLKSILSVRQREALTLFMFRRVVQSALESKLCDEIHVTSPDRTVLSEARMMGARTVHEHGRRNLNLALWSVLSDIPDEHSKATALIVHADVPLVEPSDIDDFARLGRSHSVVIVPSRDGSGTTALSLTPPTVLRPQFGAESFKRHVRAAQRARLSPKVYRNARLCFDVDQPSDIELLLTRSGARPSVARSLQEIFDMPAQRGSGRLLRE